MKSILCVIDLTESSVKVLEVAAMISTACHAHLFVLHPYRLIHNGHGGDLSSLKLHLERDARERFRILAKDIPGMESANCEFQPEIGFIADRISAHTRRGSVDMVIVGQEHTATTNDVKGFNLQALISRSNLPFVIVPSELNVEANV